MVRAEDYINFGRKSRYDTIISDLETRGFYLDSIKSTVEEAVANIKKKESRSFVIYGEPQSGKTEMMISLTAKLLDEGHKFIVVLLNDSLDLLKQNNTRFQKSKLSPTAEVFTKQLLANDENLKDIEKIIFIKKMHKI